MQRVNERLANCLVNELLVINWFEKQPQVVKVVNDG